MARMTRARREALEAARTAQKRTRDKEYRLRKRGAAMVGDLSPRVSMAEVRSMSTRELRAYARRLNRFSSERSVVLESGEVIPESVIRRINRNIAEHNRKAARERERIDKVNRDLPKVGERFVQTRVSVGVDPNTMQPYVEAEPGQTGATLQPIISTEPPKTAKQAMRRLKASERWAHPNYMRRTATQRRSIIEMLERIGMDAESDRVRRMSSLAVSVMVNRYGIFDEIDLWYMPNTSDIEGQIGYNPQEFRGFQADMNAILDSLVDV